MIDSNRFKSSVDVGDIVTSARNSKIDGKVLLPLSTVGRNLTAAEQALYPDLSTALSSEPTRTKLPVTSFSGLVITSNSDEYGVSSNGEEMYYGGNNIFHRFNYSNQTSDTIATHDSSDLIKAIACSGDGVIVAYVYWDNSSTTYILRVSNDSGASFTDISGGTGASSADTASIHIPPDGSAIIAIIPESSDLTYIRIDDPATALTVDDTRSLAANLTEGNTTGVGQASFSDNGLKFVIHYVGGGAGRAPIEYTEDAGATFTKITSYPQDFTVNSATSIGGHVAMDGANPDTIMYIKGGLTTGAGAWFSHDKGVTWHNIDAATSATSNIAIDGAVAGGWRSGISTKSKLRNGYAIMRNGDGRFYTVKLNANGTSTILDSLHDYVDVANFFDVGWATDGLSFGVAGTLGGSEYPATGGLFEVGKRLPSSPLYSNQKIVADAP